MDPAEPGQWLNGRPKQLIFLTGLDPSNKNVHSSLVNAFRSQLPNKPPLNLKFVSGELELPPKAEKSTAKGIFKKSWPLKYLESVPALIVLFLDLDWDHPSWSEKKLEAESKCASIRANCRHGSRLAVVLVQNRSVPVPSDDALAVERAHDLCQTCQLNAKELYVVPGLGDLQGFVVKLESVFHELAQGFYQQKLRTIRARSIPNNTPTLVVRQLFKLAFLSELRQDTHTALRNYRLAYEQCKDNVEHWEGIDIYEWRSVVGLLNTKVCELCFLHNTTDEAINQMIRHQTIFFNINYGVYPNAALASIEHKLWKAKQCWHFAQLYDNAILNGSPVRPSYSAGVYLDLAASIYSAANAEIATLKLAAGPLPPYPSPDPLEQDTTFFGHRPWRNGLNGLGAQEVELLAITAIMQRLVVNYEGSISLLNAAMIQFKRYGYVRMQKKIQHEIADVLYSSGDCEKALLKWTSMVSEDLPPVVLSVILHKACWAAYTVASVRDFVWTTLQLAAIEASAVDGLLSILAGRVPNIPFSNTSISPEQESSYKEKWTQVLSDPQFFTLQISKLNIFLSVKATFLTFENVQLGGNVSILVEFNSKALHVFRFSKVVVYISEASSKQGAKEVVLERNNVVVEPGCPHSFVLNFKVSDDVFEEGNTMIVSRMSLELGERNSMMFGQLELDASGLNKPSHPTHFPYGTTSLKISPSSNGIVAEGNTKVECLVGEVADYLLVIRNNTDRLAKDLKMQFKRQEQTSKASAAVLFIDGDDQVNDDAIRCPSVLAAGATATIPIKFAAQLLGEMEIILDLSFVLDGSHSPSTSKLSISVVANEPFFVKSGALTMNGVPIASMLNHSEHVLIADITANADIVISSVEWLLADNIKSLDDVTDRKSIEDSLAMGDVMNYCRVVELNSKEEDVEIPLGRIAIEWRRHDASVPVRSVVALCRLAVLPCPVKVSATVLDSPAIVRHPIRVQYVFESKHPEVLEITSSFDLSEIYMFCGDKRVTFRLLPDATRVINIVVMSLSGGRLPFPRLSLKSKDVQDSVLQHSLRSLPGTLFVLPNSKTDNSSEA